MNFFSKNKLKLIFSFFLLIYLFAHLLFFKLGILKSFNTDYTEPVLMLLEGNLSFINQYGELWNRGPFLYPLILAFQLKTALVFNINALYITSLFSIGTILFSGFILYKIARLFFSENYRHAQLTLVLYLSIPFNIYSSSMPLSETPFGVFVLLSIYYLLKGFLNFNKSKYFLLSGVTLGLALLIRPIGILLPIVYLLIIFYFFFREYKRKAVYRMLFFAFAVFLTILPWSIYNYIKTDKIILLSSNGVGSIKDGHKLYHKNYREKHEVSEHVKFIVDDFYKKRETLNTLPDIIDFLKDKFKEDKWAVINFYLYKAKRVWFGLDSQNIKKERVIKIFSFLYIVLFMIAMYKVFKKNNREQIILLSIIILVTFTFWGMAILVVPLLRYVLLSYGLFTLLIPIILEKSIKK